MTNLWIIKNGVPADNLSAYDEYVEDIKRSAIYRNDLDALKLCFEKILADPGIDTGYLAESEYPWDDEEVREVIQYIWRKIWHEASGFTALPAAMRYIPKTESYDRRGTQDKSVLHNSRKRCNLLINPPAVKIWP
ncbi:hypothetical protein [Anabaena sp. CCY 0017]|uniref:hypothetical protein n=1 Tax=Anabaena sp. CCY 0017 TaxID=3103866 RepID=UPI0039C73B8E